MPHATTPAAGRAKSRKDFALRDSPKGASPVASSADVACGEAGDVPYAGCVTITDSIILPLVER